MANTNAVTSWWHSRQYSSSRSMIVIVTHTHRKTRMSEWRSDRYYTLALILCDILSARAAPERRRTTSESLLVCFRWCLSPIQNFHVSDMSRSGCLSHIYYRTPGSPARCMMLAESRWRLGGMDEVVEQSGRLRKAHWLASMLINIPKDRIQFVKRDGEVTTSV
jgi:hypothetical protein